MSARAATAPAGWEGILDPGETILWQGRPDARLSFQIGHVFMFVFGLFFAGFALFWMIMASAAGGYFWMFGLIHFSVGLAIGIGPPFWSAWTRRHTWYTLTDRRAFIATDLPVQGRRLKSYPIEAGTPISLEGSDPATITFAEEYRRTRNGSRRVGIGFQRISGGDEVYRLIRQVQQQRRRDE